MLMTEVNKEPYFPKAWKQRKNLWEMEDVKAANHNTAVQNDQTI